MHRVIMMFKGWMSGMHHSVNHLKIIWMSTPISLIAVLWVNTYSTIYLPELSDITLLFTNMSIDKVPNSKDSKVDQIQPRSMIFF